MATQGIGSRARRPSSDNLRNGSLDIPAAASGHSYGLRAGAAEPGRHHGAVGIIFRHRPVALAMVHHGRQACAICRRGGHHVPVHRTDRLQFSMRRKSLLTSPIAWASAFAMLTCVAVLVPGIGSQINGARRWLKLGPMVLQPSELAKWAVVIFLAYWLTRKPTEKFFTGFLPAMAPVAILCLLVVIQDFGTAALIAICAFTMLLAGRIKLRHILVVLVPC